MNSEKQLIEQLMKLGLTQYEAQVFITLVTHGSGTAAQISQLSKVPRPKVYETLESLAQKGLVTVIEGSPSAYKAIELDSALKILERKYIETLDAIKKNIINIKLQQNRKIDQGIYFVKSDDTLIQVITELIENAQRRITILDNFAHILRIKQVREALYAKNQQGIITRIFSRGDYIEQLLPGLIAEFFSTDSTVNVPQETYIVVDRERFAIKFFEHFVSGVTYVGAYGNHKAFLTPIIALIEGIEQRSKSSKLLTKEINPLDYVKMLKSETPLFVDKVNYLDPSVVTYAPPYQAFVIVTEDRIIFTSVFESDVQVFAIPRYVIYGIDIATMPAVGNVVRLQYTKMGHPEFLLVGNLKPDVLVRTLVSSRAS